MIVGVRDQEARPDAVDASPHFGQSAYVLGKRPGGSMEVDVDWTRLRSELRQQCVKTPGVYGLIGDQGQLIYVGMSKCVAKRLSQYFQGGRRDRKEREIGRQARRILWEPTGHEFAAKLRELELIRRHWPPYNVRGTGRAVEFGYVCLTGEDAARFRLSKSPPKTTRRHWGPLPISACYRHAVDRLNLHFGLRDCRSSVTMAFAEQHELFEVGRTVKCVRGETGSCLGPCGRMCTREQYEQRVAMVCRLLDGSDRSSLDDLRGRMQQAASGRLFEVAARLRDTLVYLEQLSERLERLRRLQQEYWFVYPLQVERGHWWYLIAGGEIAAVVSKPTSRTAARRVASVIRATYFNAEPTPILLDDGRPYRYLIDSWFRSRPDQRQVAMSPDMALQTARRAAA